MTIQEAVTVLQRDNPGMRFARSADDSAIAVWDESRWVVIASRIIGDAQSWYSCPSLLLNGKEPDYQWNDAGLTEVL